METYVIHVTKQCNMKCMYCYEEDKTSIYEWEEIKTFIDNLIANSPDEFIVEFLGGEPLLAWDLIKKAYEYLESFPNKRIESYALTTNGTILTEEILDYLIKNPKFGFHVSLDGHKYANQLRVMKDGKNSYDIVMANLKKVMNAKVHSSIHIVTHPYNVGYLLDSVTHLYEEGVRSIGIGTVEKTIKIGKKYVKTFLSEMNLISLKIISGELEGLSIDLFNSVKSTDDVRCYVREKEGGKIIAESYGRVASDVTTQEKYYVDRCADKTAGTYYIEHIRQTAYDKHQENIKRGQ